MLTLAHVRNDGAQFFLMGIIISIVGALILRSAHQARQKMVRLCEDLARRLGGSFESANLLSNYRVRCVLHGRPCVLEIHDGKQPYSSLKVQLPRDIGGWLKIADQGAGDFLLGLFQPPKFSTGDRHFDEAYSVRGWPEHFLRKVFSPEQRRKAMRAVRRLNHCAGYSLEVKSGLLELRIRERVDDLGVGMAMVRTAEDFMGYLFDLDAVLADGIQWGESREQMSGLCPICTTVLKEPLVRCGRCQSPHHQECWDYLGGCATFGCDPGSRRQSA